MSRDRRRKDPWGELFGFDPDDLFRDFDRMFDELFTHLEESDEDSAVWGFSVKSRPGEEPEVRRFGNVKPSPEVGEESGYDVESDRTPLIDVFEDGDQVRVVVEMPGVSREDVQLDATPSRLRVRADGEMRRYDESVDLPSRVDPESASAEYTNGVLQVTLDAAEDDEGPVRIDVE